MIRKLAAAAMLAALLPAAAFADEPKFSVAKTTIGDLMKNDATKAVLVKIIPDVANNPQLEQGYAMTLPDIVQYVPDQLTDEKLKAIDAELAKIK